MCAGLSEKTEGNMKIVSSRTVGAIGFASAFCAQALVLMTHRMELPIGLPFAIFIGFVLYFLRERMQSFLFGFGIGTIIILTGLFWWLTVNGMID